ncbi:MAG: RluA family pseudouridine synthase [Alphaproteobacteria bacterium]
MTTTGQKLDIPQDAVGLRLDKYLMVLYPQIKYGEWARLFRKGHVRLDSKRVTGSERLQAHQSLRLPPISVLDDLIAASTVAPKAPVHNLSKKMEETVKSWILFQDEDIMVLNKPAGLAVQGGTSQATHLDGLLQSFGHPTGTVFKLVHRLDKDTSGVLVVAKTKKAAAALAAAFKYHDLFKVYVALTQRVPHPLEGIIKAPISEQTDGIKETMVVDPAGKKAVTFYRVISHAGKTAACIALSPETGRTHQLRVHLANQNCPVLGDGQYGDASVFWPNLPKNLYLHAYKISFQHPIKHTKLTFSAPLPAHFLEALDTMGMDPKDIVKGLNEFTTEQ